MSVTDPLVLPADSISAERLNAGCYCRTLDPERLRQQLESEPGLAGSADLLRSSRPFLFSSTTVFVSASVARTMADAVAVIERVAVLPQYQRQALARAPQIAALEFGPKGVFMGYDFHLSPLGPRLIEVNTNAGGALLNLALARAQQACCEPLGRAELDRSLADVEQQMVEMLRNEWHLQRGDADPGTLAIVDDDPQAQYLAPEFELFRRLCTRHGIDARVLDASALEWRDGRLWHAGQAIDMVYNRLTDFYLGEAHHASLRSAYQAGGVVLTPHPRAHALQADKRNLITLSDPRVLADWGVSAVDRELLAAVVPHTRKVEPADAAELWATRRNWFFKPAAGYGSKATYRGDKLTRRVWDEILVGDYVAQALVPPTERGVDLDGSRSDLKFDLRAYSYDGQVQLLAARMYSGQTTNFRTPGGGFAPVVVVDS
jgi:hypothetical protein